MLLNLHSMLAENLMPDSIDEGRLRQHGVEIGRGVYRLLPVPVQIDEMLVVLVAKINHVTDLFEQSFFVMIHLP